MRTEAGLPPPRKGSLALRAFMLLLANTPDCESYILYTMADSNKRDKQCSTEMDLIQCLAYSSADLKMPFETPQTEEQLELCSAIFLG